jgi:hypothetical protein
MSSKLGFHIQRRRPGWPNVIADTVPAVVKSLEWSILDDWLPEEQTELDKIQRARKWTEYKVFLLGRHAVPYQGLERPADRAYEFWRRLLDDLTGGDRQKEGQVLARMRRFHAWEGYNEVGTGPASELLGRFDAALARYFHHEGMRYAGGGFSLTHPTADEWRSYCAALLEEVAAGRGERPDFLHFHEYWYPRGDWDTLLHPDGSINAGKMRAATQGYMLHWRELYQLPETPWELRLPVIITECGWDQGWPQQVGFRNSPRSDVDYFKWLVWYDQELQKPLDGIDYVVGAAIYTYGHEPAWASFEIDDWQGRGIMELLRAYLREENREPHPWAWQAAWEQKPPVPEVEESHFVLLAQNASLAWRHALDKYLDTFKVTNGQSLDDAVRLAAKHHHITLVGTAGSPFGLPQEWEEEIRRRNPKIILDRMEARTVEELRRVANRRAETGDRYGQNDLQPGARSQRRWLPWP